MNNFKKLFFRICVISCVLGSSLGDQLGVDKVRWVSKDLVSTSAMIPAGIEDRPRHASTLYVARGLHMGRKIPGKYHASTSKLYIALSGTEFQQSNRIELLVAPKGSLIWVPGVRRNIQSRDTLILGGIHPITLETLYICRGWYDNELMIGRYSYDEGYCLIPYYGEQKVESFELLALNSYGSAIGAGRGTTE